MAASFIENLVPNFLPTSNAVAGGVGQLAALDLDPFALNILKYPQELATPDAPHYVRFDINLPDSSKYLKGQLSVPTPRNLTPSAAQGNADLNGAAGAINMTNGDINQAATAGGIIEGGEAVVKNLGDGPISALGAGFGTGLTVGVGVALAGAVTKQTNINVKPKTTRTATSISLYMPDTVTTAYDHDWNALSLTDALGKLGMYSSFGSSLNINGIEEGLKSDIQNSWASKSIVTSGTSAAFNNAKVPTELKAQVAQQTGAVGADFATFALKNQGLAVNPHLEMVFKGTQNRRYIFEFDFQPRSQKEAQNIRTILQTFRAYAAPELADVAQSNNGRYFIPPAEFDISYRFNNVENPYIARVSTCALTNIAINWNQSGAFATFTDGAPVHIHVALTFVEIDIIYRELIANKGY